MLVGEIATFAVESEITYAYARPSFRALGFFVIHVQGHSFGVRAPDASMLACSFEEVARRISDRGKHTASFADAEASLLAKSVREAIYDASEPASTSCGVSATEFRDSVYSRQLLWAPDGDEAFDDSSYVLHFDIPTGVRIVAFKCLDTGIIDAASVADVRLPEESFYGVLAEWYAAFDAEWRNTPQTPEGAA